MDIVRIEFMNNFQFNFKSVKIIIKCWKKKEKEKVFVKDITGIEVAVHFSIVHQVNSDDTKHCAHKV